MSDTSTTWYVLHEGVEEGGGPEETNPIASPNLEFVENSFRSFREQGLLDRDRGMFITEVRGVTPKQEEGIFGSLDEKPLENLVFNDFEGFEHTLVKKEQSSIDDWLAESLAPIEEEGEPDEDGWYRN